MLNLPPSVRLFVATQPVDGRKGPDSLMALVRDAFRLDVFSGHLFVFFSRRWDRVRIVYWDRDGIAMWTNQPSSHYTSFSFELRVLASDRELRRAARSASRSQRLQCFAGGSAGSS